MNSFAIGWLHCKMRLSSVAFVEAHTIRYHFATCKASALSECASRCENHSRVRRWTVSGMKRVNCSYVNFSIFRVRHATVPNEWRKISEIRLVLFLRIDLESIITQLHEQLANLLLLKMQKKKKQIATIYLDGNTGQKIRIVCWANNGQFNPYRQFTHIVITYCHSSHANTVSQKLYTQRKESSFSILCSSIICYCHDCFGFGFAQYTL